MPHPLLYELNTRCWLRELSENGGRAITLAEVPETELAGWQAHGFTHIWLMGVWTVGPRVRAQALADPGLQASYAEALPGWQAEDVAGSPYAIADYQVAPALGGDGALGTFRAQLHRHGLKLVLDFVPNHLGLDHAWVREQPDLFVQSPQEVPGTFPEETRVGRRWLAHGKDPFFPPWTDTVQLDYRRPATRAAMTALLQSVAARGDGLRCDMAMLLLNDVFVKTWERFPPAGSAPAAEEFWASAIDMVKGAHPDLLLLAEAYWGLEGRLRELGFDYTYDKVLYDNLVGRDAVGVQRHLFERGPGGIAAGAHFLENHDEPRIASLLSPAEHRAAALVILGLPGLRFLHEGQLTGARLKTPVQLARRAAEPKQAEIERMYQGLLQTLRASAVGQQRGELVAPRAWPDNPTAQNFVLVQWQAQPPEFDLVAVNLAPDRSQCRAPLTVAGMAAQGWVMKDRLGQEEYRRCADDLRNPGLFLDLPPHGAQLFHFRPAGP